MNPPRVVITVEKLENGFTVRRMVQNLSLGAGFPFESCLVFREDEYMDLNSHVGSVLSEFNDLLNPNKKQDDETP